MKALLSLTLPKAEIASTDARRADESVAPHTPQQARRKSSEDDVTDGTLTFLVPNGYSLFFGVTLWVEQGGVLRGYSTTQKSALSLDLTNYRVELVDLFQFHTVFSHSFFLCTKPKLSEKFKVLHQLHLRLSKSA